MERYIMEYDYRQILQSIIYPTNHSIFDAATKIIYRLKFLLTLSSVLNIKIFTKVNFKKQVVHVFECHIRNKLYNLLYSILSYCELIEENMRKFQNMIFFSNFFNLSHIVENIMAKIYISLC